MTTSNKERNNNNKTKPIGFLIDTQLWLNVWLLFLHILQKVNPRCWGRGYGQGARALCGKQQLVNNHHQGVLCLIYTTNSNKERNSNKTKPKAPLRWNVNILLFYIYKFHSSYIAFKYLTLGRKYQPIKLLTSLLLGIGSRYTQWTMETDLSLLNIKTGN